MDLNCRVFDRFIDFIFPEIESISSCGADKATHLFTFLAWFIWRFSSKSHFDSLFLLFKIMSL